MTIDQVTARCPHAGDNDRKSRIEPHASPWHEGVERLDAGTFRITGFAPARQLLRMDGLRQAGFKAELLERVRGRSRMAVLFQEGEEHRKQRLATARFFAPRVVDTRYRDLMTALSDDLVERLRKQGTAELDAMSMELAVAVAAEIIGLTDSDRKDMTQRLDRSLSRRLPATLGPSAVVQIIQGQWRLWRFYRLHVLPAIRARRAQPREDVISHLLGEGYSGREILRECLMYGSAGMVTTREFIVMAAWYLIERDDLRARFLDADEPGRIALLEEILRLEPVVGYLYRRAQEDVELDDAGKSIAIPKGALVEIDVRAVNADRQVAGECPHRLDPDRAHTGKVPPSGIGFGDGHHRCPGASVALQESAIFLDRLLRVPGLSLARAPDVTWNTTIASYELRGALLTLDRQVAARGAADRRMEP